jgi:hypothetical protein
MRRSLFPLWLAAGLAGCLALAALAVPVAGSSTLPGATLFILPTRWVTLPPALTLLAVDEEKPPKEADFPELYVKKFPEKPAPGYQVYTLSGGEDPTTPIHADDDVTVRLNGEMIFADNDGWACPDDRGGKWKGAPITFHAKPDDKITLVLYDLVGDEWGIGPVYLHRGDGKRAVLQSPMQGQSEGELEGHLFEDGPPGPDAKRNKALETTWVIKDIIP